LPKANAKGLRLVKEFRDFKGGDLVIGKELKVDLFAKGDKVSVTAKSKGKGFQGVVRRHHFSGVGMTTHGQSGPRACRLDQSVSSSYPSRVFKGMRMAGRMGFRNVTVKNLTVVQVILESNLILVKGSVPGAINTYVEITK